MTTISKVMEEISFPVKREVINTPKGIDTGWDNIYRDDNGESLGVVSRDYKLVTHEEFLEKAIKGFKNLPDVKVDRFYLPDNGRRFCLNISFAKDYEVGKLEDGAKDLIRPGASLWNSFDRSLQWKIEGYFIRLICSNGMVTREAAYGVSKRHMKNFNF